MANRDGGVTVPMWAVIAIVGVSLFNFAVLITIVMWARRPQTAPIPVTSDVAIGLHIQLLEAILAALAFGLAVVGVVGFNVIRNAAINAAQSEAEKYFSAGAAPRVQAPDLPPIPAENAVQVQPEAKDL